MGPGDERRARLPQVLRTAWGQNGPQRMINLFYFGPESGHVRPEPPLRGSGPRLPHLEAIIASDTAGSRRAPW